MSVFRLASHLGKTISELDITWSEFVYWQAYLRLEPTEEPANKRTAAVLAQITNMSGRSLRNNKTVSGDDFLGGKDRAQSAEEQIAFMRSIDGDDE